MSGPAVRAANRLKKTQPARQLLCPPPPLPASSAACLLLLLRGRNPSPSVARPSLHQFGTVGPPVGPIEVKIDHVAGRDNEGEGEVCYRGRSIMMGYMKDAAKTKEAIDPTGWLHSGDVGAMGVNGMLRITGRLKELIITAGGENIAPVPIEDKIKAVCPGVANAMMIGDKRKYNGAQRRLVSMAGPDPSRPPASHVASASPFPCSLRSHAFGYRLPRSLRGASRLQTRLACHRSDAPHRQDCPRPRDWLVDG